MKFSYFVWVLKDWSPNIDQVRYTSDLNDLVKKYCTFHFYTFIKIEVSQNQYKTGKRLFNTNQKTEDRKIFLYQTRKGKSTDYFVSYKSKNPQPRKDLVEDECMWVEGRILLHDSCTEVKREPSVKRRIVFTNSRTETGSPDSSVWSFSEDWRVT